MKKYKETMRILLFFLFLISCATPKGMAPQELKTGEKGAQTLQESAREAWQVKWENWIREAKKEGRVMVYATFSGEVRSALISAFKDKFGIDVNIVTAKGGEISEKIFSEKRAGIHLVDLYVGGPTTLTSVIKPSGLLIPLDPVLLLPEVIEPKVWWKGQPDWIDKEHMVMAFQAYPTAPLALNTNMIKPEEIKSYRDLLNPRWKGKCLLNDPTIAGRGSDWVAVVGGVIMGMDFVREFARQEPIIIRDQRLQVQWLAQGKYPIALQHKTDVVREFIQAGAPIVEHTPVEGTILAAGSGNLGMFERASHPNAARVFVNWLLSREGQTVFSKAYGAQSGRLDIPTDHLHASSLRVPGAKYFSQYSEDFIAKRAGYYSLAREIYGHLLSGR